MVRLKQSFPETERQDETLLVQTLFTATSGNERNEGTRGNSQRKQRRTEKKPEKKEKIKKEIENEGEKKEPGPRHRRTCVLCNEFTMNPMIITTAAMCVTMDALLDSDLTSQWSSRPGTKLHVCSHHRIECEERTEVLYGKRMSLAQMNKLMRKEGGWPDGVEHVTEIELDLRLKEKSDSGLNEDGMVPSCSSIDTKKEDFDSSDDVFDEKEVKEQDKRKQKLGVRKKEEEDWNLIYPRKLDDEDRGMKIDNTRKRKKRKTVDSRLCDVCSQRTRIFHIIRSKNRKRILDHVLGTNMANQEKRLNFFVCKPHYDLEFVEKTFEMYGKKWTVADFDRRVKSGVLRIPLLDVDLLKGECDEDTPTTNHEESPPSSLNPDEATPISNSDEATPISNSVEATPISNSDDVTSFSNPSKAPPLHSSSATQSANSVLNSNESVILKRPLPSSIPLKTHQWKVSLKTRTPSILKRSRPLMMEARPTSPSDEATTTFDTEEAKPGTVGIEEAEDVKPTVGFGEAPYVNSDDATSSSNAEDMKPNIADIQVQPVMDSDGSVPIFNGESQNPTLLSDRQSRKPSILKKPRRKSALSSDGRTSTLLFDAKRVKMEEEEDLRMDGDSVAPVRTDNAMEKECGTSQEQPIDRVKTGTFDEYEMFNVEQLMRQS